MRPISLGADRAELAVESGPWLADPIAGVSRGSLGVALDDVTGHVVARGTDEHRWPVSLSIRIDFLADPPLDKTSMSVHGELIARDERSGTTRGSVTDDSGRTIALVTQRSHLVAVEAQPTSPRTSFDLPSVETTVRDALGFTVSAGGIVELPPTPLAANGMGNVHGGVLICGSEFAAMSAVDAGGVLRTTSIDIAYVRPGNAGDTTTFACDVVHRGRSMSVVRVVAAGSTGKPCAVATVIVQTVPA
ncbi:uncharacterized domain 1-containing protein [Gordonia westfalica]|uniref:Uncharacterized domain 1-containing protein n=1 Tax=Gordonia westfalica TaxID=158898 RepID=A0A1H2LGG4_9ACTN|nr:uncharacterized domain 1-containing protein [Gordonia westfalica]